MPSLLFTGTTGIKIEVRSNLIRFWLQASLQFSGNDSPNHLAHSAEALIIRPNSKYETCEES